MNDDSLGLDPDYERKRLMEERQVVREIRWYVEDGVHYGWGSDQNMQTEEHRYLVKQVPRTNDADTDMIWAGWVVDSDRMSSQCVTHDHSTAAAAQHELTTS